MSPNVQRRLERLEQQQSPVLRQRMVWWDEGEPEPQAQPGERLTIIRWTWSDEDMPTEASEAANSGGPH